MAGHRGLVGRALIRQLEATGYQQLLTRSSAELDLRNQEQTEAFFEKERPDYVFLAAARVGGILANDTYPAEFIFDNLQIQANVIHQAWKQGVKKLIFLGSSCIYPVHALQPLKEEYLLTGPLEKTNEPYAIAKLAGIRMCQAYRKQYGADFISVLPTNLYGPYDNFDLRNSHVLPALLKKFHEAVVNKSPVVEVWGTGTPRREFMHADDAASACIFLMNHYSADSPVNIGVGEDITIKELAELIAGITGFAGRLEWDTSKPDGTPRKWLDISILQSYGWKSGIPLREGIGRVYRETFNTVTI